MSRMRTLKRGIISGKYHNVPKTVMVWAVMYYKCEDCGAGYNIFLENTLERHNGKDHKPVPFGIRCRKCGGFHCYDRSGLVRLKEERPLRSGENYFRDDPKMDCGKPVVCKEG